MIKSTHVGSPRNRVDGPLKVSGEARYSAEYSEDKILYGYVVGSTIAKGRILSFDTTHTELVSGFVSLYTHKHRPNASKRSSKYKDDDKAHGEHFRPLLDEKVVYSGQPIALVVAETFEAAREAAHLNEPRLSAVRSDHERAIRKPKSSKNSGRTLKANLSPRSFTQSSIKSLKRKMCRPPIGIWKLRKIAER